MNSIVVFVFDIYFCVYLNRCTFTYKVIPFFLTIVLKI